MIKQSDPQLISDIYALLLRTEEICELLDQTSPKFNITYAQTLARIVQDGLKTIVKEEVYT